MCYWKSQTAHRKLVLMSSKLQYFRIYWESSSLKGDGAIHLWATRGEEARSKVRERIEQHPDRYPEDATIWMTTSVPIDVKVDQCVICSGDLERVTDDHIAGQKYRCKSCGRFLWVESIA